MPRAWVENWTHRGRSKIADVSPDNRPKTRRLEGGGDFPLIFFLTCRLANDCSPRNTFPLLVLLTARNGQAERNPDLTSDPIAYPRVVEESSPNEGFGRRRFLRWVARSRSGAFRPASRLTSNTSLARVAYARRIERKYLTEYEDQCLDGGFCEAQGAGGPGFHLLIG
jgi:hypothetical protein